MTLWERWSLHLAALITGASGVAYGWLRYFGQRVGEFGLEPHPTQALLQHLHVLGSPLLVFALGVVVRSHALPRHQSGRIKGRTTGLLLGLGLAPMILSGYAIQVVLEPSARLLWAWTHGLASLLFLAAYGAHYALNWTHAADPNPS